jgi:glutathione synthase/RimK-type ligase-like ATP-grasp enzyme
MGMFSWGLKGNYKRHYQNLKDLSKENGRSAFLMFFDTALCTLIYKSGLQDYLNYKFYEKTFKERSEYATIGYQDKLYRLAASYDYADFFSNKVNFHKNFKDFVKREYASASDGYEAIEQFLKKHAEVVRKPITGIGGHDVEKIKTKDIKDIKKFYEKLKKDDCFIEEVVKQNQEWNKLNPDSLNTIRIVTKCVNGKSKLMYAVARIGSGESIVDNFHRGGVGVKVNTDKGVLEGLTIDKAGKESDITTKTKIKVEGFKIPYWKEIVKMVNEAAKVNDNVNLVGWDVAITDEGPLIIEGNRGPGMDIIQVLYQRGVKKDMEAVKKEILEGKK